MRIRCDYCGNYMEDTDKTCPSCGAPNPGLNRGGEGEPRTIAELLAFAKKHNLPLEKMRFFIGENYTGPRAFGIYQDEEGQFVVYKNKANGERAVRYRGSDEAFAVNEIYQKMRSEIVQRKESGKGVSKPAPPPTPGSKPPKQKKHPYLRKFLKTQLVILIIFLGFCVYAICEGMKPGAGYYCYNDQNYYHLDGSWYAWDDDYNDWYYVDYVDDELVSNYENYFQSKDYDTAYGGYDFEDTGYYEDYLESQSSSDSWDSDWDDSDWDYDDDWDYNDTDWDSDW